MKEIFELTQAKNLATGMVILSVILFAFAIATRAFGWFDRWQGIAIGDMWRSGNALPIFGAIILGVILLVVGIATHTICNNISRLMKSYDEALSKKMDK